MTRIEIRVDTVTRPKNKIFAGGSSVGCSKPNSVKLSDQCPWLGSGRSGHEATTRKTRKTPAKCCTRYMVCNRHCSRLFPFKLKKNKAGQTISNNASEWISTGGKS